jgi:hypothetical protein
VIGLTLPRGSVAGEVTEGPLRDRVWVGDVERDAAPLEGLGPARHLVLDERAEASRARVDGRVEGNGLGPSCTIAAAD